MSGIILPFKNLRLRVGAFMLLLLSALNSVAQSENVGIGTTKPDNSALLDLTSTLKRLVDSTHDPRTTRKHQESSHRFDSLSN